MDRSSRLADLKLVSKYYPVANSPAANHTVANYSYPHPRNDTLANYGTARASSDRSSLGSEGSAPGLIDDRTDSEVSVDDDYQYHAHAAEIWDTFWQPGAQGKQEEPLILPRKQYPALIPSPQQRRRRQQNDGERTTPAWPLPDSPIVKRQRKPAATYSPFPKPLILPPRDSSKAPSWTSSRPSPTRLSPMQPQRPPRPDSSLLPPCLKELSPVASDFSTSVEKTQTASFNRPLTPTPHRRFEPLEPRPSTSMDVRSSTPWGDRNTIYSVSTTSATDLPMLDAPSSSAPVSSTSSQFPHLDPPQPTPQSFFEDSDSDSESQGRSFFRFHKRSDSDTRRMAKETDSTTQRPRRTRASTAPSSPSRHPPERSGKTPTPGRKRPAHDVFGRMLGRRSR